MSKIIQNIKEKLSRRKSTEPTLKQTTASNTEANARPGVGTSLGSDGKTKEVMSKEATSKEASKETAFSTQPHPAKTNDPADLQAPGSGSGGSRQGAHMEAFHAREPYVPSDQIKNNLPEPLSHEELQARQAALASEVPGHGTQQGGLV